MDKPTLIIGATLELIALIVIVRLWMRRPLRIVPTIFWSLVLLVPFFGLLLYFFLRDEPEAHPDRVDPYYSGAPGNDATSHHDGSHGI